MRTPAGSFILWVTSAGTTLPRSMLGVSQSFWGSMQIEVLDRRYWSTRAELASAMFEWIEAFYNPVRRHYLQRNLSQRGDSLHFFSVDRPAVRLP